MPWGLIIWFSFIWACPPPCFVFWSEQTWHSCLPRTGELAGSPRLPPLWGHVHAATFECLPFCRFYRAETQPLHSRAGDFWTLESQSHTWKEESAPRKNVPESLTKVQERPCRVPMKCKIRLKVVSSRFHVQQILFLSFFPPHFFSTWNFQNLYP